jgi:putative ABC transport system substrate-binding protein
LRELGYVAGTSIVVEASHGADTSLPDRASALLRSHPDVMVTVGAAAATAAQRATADVPIVAVGLGGDPVALGLVASLGRPGGNLTGLLINLPDLAGKQLEVLLEVRPGIRRVAVLWNPAHGAHPSMLRALDRAAAGLGVSLHPVAVSHPDEFAAGFAAAADHGAEAVLILHDPLTFQHRARIVALAAQRGLPAVYDCREWVDDGGLVSYGPSLTDAYHRAARYVDRILRGARAADLPIEQPARMELVLNLRTSQALGLTLPPALLLDATAVIQ